MKGAGLASGTFYNYFSDKESVFRAIIDTYLEDLSQRIGRERRSAENLVGFVGPAYSVFFHAIAADPETYEFTKRNEDVLKSMYNSNLMEMIVGALKNDITEAVQLRVLPSIDPELLSSSFVGVAYELGQRMIKLRLNPEYVAQFATQLFVGGIEGFGDDSPLVLGESPALS